MAGSFDVDTTDYSGLVQTALAVAVYWYTAPDEDDDEDEGTYELIPNVICRRIDYREGPDPPTARFEYRMSQVLEIAYGWPSQFEELFPLDATGYYVVENDDRIVVAALNPDGSMLILFDGFAAIPQADVRDDHQRVTFTALGVAARCNDDTIHTRVQRDASTPTDTSGNSDNLVHLPCRFNPAGERANGTVGILPNGTPNFTVTDPDDDPIGYPVFVPSLLQEREIQTNNVGGLVAYWWIGGALLYLLNQPDPGDDYITWPDSGTITNLVNTLIPGPNGTVTKTSQVADTIIRDYDCTGKPLPIVLHDLLGYAGFRFAWVTGSDDDDNPITYLNIYRTDAAATQAPKQVFLQPYGTDALDPSVNNVTQLSLARDSKDIINAVGVETMPKTVEITVLLAPGFQPDSADAQPSSSPTGGWNQFKSPNIVGASSTIRRKYRWFIADECGDGHWNMATQALSSTALALVSVFPNYSNGATSYSVRYRPGSDTLITLDDAGAPRKATLEVYLGQLSGDPAISPAGAGTTGWYPITKGWRGLNDRLGIEVTIEDPEQWHTGNVGTPADVIRAITWSALPMASGSQTFTLRYTTTIPSDQIISAGVKPRAASPTQFARWRRVDAADHFQYTTVDPSSRYYNGSGSPVVVRNDTQNAIDHANQIQRAHEMPHLAGQIVIPYITTYYQIGDLISEIDGRDCDLSTDTNQANGETPTYPWVRGLSFSFEGDKQYTILQLSDDRGEHANSW